MNFIMLIFEFFIFHNLVQRYKKLFKLHNYNHYNRKQLTLFIFISGILLQPNMVILRHIVLLHFHSTI